MISSSLPILSSAPAPDGSAVLPKSRNFTLIRPGYLSGKTTYSVPIGLPMGPAYIAAVTREAGHQVTVVDALALAHGRSTELNDFICHGLTPEQVVALIPEETEVLGVSCMFTQDWILCREIIKGARARFPSILIVAGGEHITAEPEMSFDDCPGLDLCVLGEGEETIVEILSAAGHEDRLHAIAGIAYRRDGELVQTESRKRIRDIESIPRPAWDLFPVEFYLNNRWQFGVNRGRNIGVVATRGCPYKCTFCSNPSMYGKSYFTRDPDDVLDEIQDAIDKYQVENVEFYDLTMVIKRQWVLDFCRRIDERGMRFTWQLPTGTRSEMVDDEVAAAFYRTGCRNIGFSPESGSPETLKVIKKQIHLDRLFAAVVACVRQGLVVKSNFIVGFPHEHRRHVWETIFFSWKLAWAGMDSAIFHIFSPYPGTELFRELRQRGEFPKLDDGYLISLLNFKSFWIQNPTCKNISVTELMLLRLFASVSYFAVLFLRRPWKFVPLFKSIFFKRRPETELEDRLQAIYRGFRGSRGTMQHSEAEKTEQPSSREAATV